MLEFLSGAVTLSRKVGKERLIVAQLRSGSLLGEMSLMGDPVRRETAVAAVATETIEVGREGFLKLIALEDAQIEPLQNEASKRMTDNALMEVRPEVSELMNFLMGIGLGEATVPIRLSTPPNTTTMKVSTMYCWPVVGPVEASMVKELPAMPARPQPSAKV